MEHEGVAASAKRRSSWECVVPYRGTPPAPSAPRCFPRFSVWSLILDLSLHPSSPLSSNGPLLTKGASDLQQLNLRHTEKQILETVSGMGLGTLTWQPSVFEPICLWLETISSAINRRRSGRQEVYLNNIDLRRQLKGDG